MQTLQTRNAYQLAYETIRNNILDGIFKGGTKLVEEKLASHIGVSRTPIREAIRRLEQEGLIRDKLVYQPTTSDLLYSFELRMLIDCHAVKVAARTRSEESLYLLKQTLIDSRVNSFYENVKANKKFHDLIIKECKNPIIIQAAERVNSIIYLFIQTLTGNKRPFNNEEHKQIFDAIADKNENLAETLMERHLKEDLQFILRLNGDY